jgi:hypothetical protein
MKTEGLLHFHPKPFNLHTYVLVFCALTWYNKNRSY